MPNEELLKKIQEAAKNNTTDLDLSSKHLTELPPELFHLTKLIRLNLSQNDLTELPPEICKLTNLTALYLGGNKLTKLPSELCQLTGLTILSLSGNKLTALPPDIIRLTGLAKISLRGNQLTKLPPEIVQLPNLNDLDLSRTKLTELPSQLFQLPKLKTLKLDDCPLTNPPPEIVEKGLEAIRTYFAAGKGGMQSVNEVKLILIGEGAAGKTSLVKQLLGQSVDGSEKTTQGISIKGWEQEIGGRKIRINIWDFGGQEIQHATHQFFLSNRSLYILVLNSRKDERAEYWLRHIEAFGGDSPVLVVLNKHDENPAFDVNRAFLLEKYPSICGFFFTSCTTGMGIADFKKALLTEVAKMEMLKTVWPVSWFAVKRRLEDMDNPFISADEYRSICKQAGITEAQSRETLVDFLHDLGVAVHFRDFDLGAMHVLNPVWITNAVYKIITAEKMADSRGLLDLKCLGEILPHDEDDPLSCPQETHLFIMRLMEKFELCYPVPNNAVLIPQLLSVPESPFTFDYANSLRFTLHYPDFLPPSVFPRFMVNVYKDIEDGLHWRTGVVLNDNQNGVRAVIKADTEARRINIWIQGERRRDYLHYLRYLLIYINSSFEKTTVSERVPMPDAPDRTADYETLLNYAKEDIPYYIPEGTNKKYSVKELLGLVQLKDAGELAIISGKIALDSVEKLSLVEMLLKVLKVNLFPPSIIIDWSELFKLILAWDKQRQRKPRK